MKCCVTLKGPIDFFSLLFFFFQNRYSYALVASISTGVTCFHRTTYIPKQSIRGLSTLQEHRNVFVLQLPRSNPRVATKVGGVIQDRFTPENLLLSFIEMLKIYLKRNQLHAQNSVCCCACLHQKCGFASCKNLSRQKPRGTRGRVTGKSLD